MDETIKVKKLNATNCGILSWLVNVILVDAISWFFKQFELIALLYYFEMSKIGDYLQKKYFFAINSSMIAGRFVVSVLLSARQRYKVIIVIILTSLENRVNIVAGVPSIILAGNAQ